jgi:hypothetical protein
MHKKFLSLNLDNYKHPTSHKLPFTRDRCRSYGTLLETSSLLLSTSSFFIPGKFGKRESFYIRRCERKPVLLPPLLAGLPQAFRMFCPRPSCHERPVILHTTRQTDRGINITIHFLFSDQDSILRQLLPLPIPYYFSLKNRN